MGMLKINLRLYSINNDDVDMMSLTTIHSNWNFQMNILESFIEFFDALVQFLDAFEDDEQMLTSLAGGMIVGGLTVTVWLLCLVAGSISSG